MPEPIPPSPFVQDTPCSVFHTLANTAVLCLLASLVINLFLGGAAQMALDGGMGGVFVIGALMLLALVFGAISLCGIPRYGAKCLLWEGLISVLIPVLLISLAIPVYRTVQMKAQAQMHVQQRVESHKSGR